MTKPAASPTAIAEAVAYAAKWHGDQVRKGTTIAYLSHLLGVCALALDHGATTEQAQAAVLHDVVEDGGGQPRLDDVRSVFGEGVADMVSALSDAAPLPGESKPPWKVRKTAYLEHLAALVADGHPAVLISACDKLHNAMSIVADATAPDGDPGLQVFERFSASASETAWYYGELAGVLSAADLPVRLGDLLATTVARLVGLTEQATAEGL